MSGRAVVAGLVVFAAAWRPAAAQYGIYFDYHSPDPAQPKHIGHPHVDGVLLRWNWKDVEPEPGRLDFSPIERDAAPWVKAGKKVLVGVTLAGQHDVETPGWVFDKVAAIDFIRTGKDSRVRVPKYWDANFLPAVSPLIRAFGARYDKDPRIEAVMIGVGHLGFLTAAPNKGGAEAFLKAGWTPAPWKAYAEAMIRLYREAFPSKPLFIRGESLVVRCPDPASIGFPGSKPHFTDVRDGILFAAATQYGIGVGCNGLEGDVNEFLATGIPALYERLAPGALEGRYRLEIADDWPLWVNAKRRSESKIDQGSDNENYKRCLDNAVGAAPGLPKIPIGWMKMLETDLDCTDPKSPDYQKDCEEKLIWLKSRLLRPSSGP